MFTGLIETVGTLIALRRSGSQQVVELKAADLPTGEVRVGDSVAVNGACLTVTAIQGDMYSFDVSPETVSKTAFSSLSPGSSLNLERALKLGSRLDGHLVTGHIDCVGQVKSVMQFGNSIVLTVAVPAEHAALLVEKGSVAIDGISLTINDLSDDGFTVALIPHTVKKTNLVTVKPGREVNIETDIIGKYVARLLHPHHASKGLTIEKLMQNGFV